MKNTRILHLLTLIFLFNAVRLHFKEAVGLDKPVMSPDESLSLSKKSDISL